MNDRVPAQTCEDPDEWGARAAVGRRPGEAAPAVGVRRPWSEVPTPLRDWVGELLGTRIIGAVTQPGGFSPGVAARLRLADGRGVFVKAVGPTPNPDSPGIHRAEARIAAALPLHAPVPRLLGTAEQEGWVVLLFEDVEGSLPAQPWVAAELTRVLDALAALTASLTPSPITAPSLEARLGGAFQGWRRLAGEAVGAGLGVGAAFDPWALRHLEALAELEAQWVAGAQGETLAHGDLRADNILLTPDRVVFVDWPWACVAAPWFDLLAMLPSVRMQGGPPPDEVFTSHPVSQASEQDAVTSVLAAVAGYFVDQAVRPAPPGLPTLRAFQAAQGGAALEWLRARTRWR